MPTYKAMSTLALGYRKMHRKITSGVSVRVPWKMIFCAALALCLAMLVFYVFEANELTKGTYLIKNYNKQIDNLIQENKNLETNFVQTSFLGGVQEKARELGFERTSDIKYAQIPTNSLAEAK